MASFNSQGQQLELNLRDRVSGSYGIQEESSIKGSFLVIKAATNESAGQPPKQITNQ